MLLTRSFIKLRGNHVIELLQAGFGVGPAGGMDFSQLLNNPHVMDMVSFYKVHTWNVNK